jgi:putative phosphoesterase
VCKAHFWPLAGHVLVLTGSGLTAHNGFQMRIGLLSDTHIPDAMGALPPAITEVFRDVDLILHAGDIYVTSVLDELQRIAPVLAARGDDDYGDTLADERVKYEHMLQLEGLTVQLVHERPYRYVSVAWQSKHSAGEAGYETPDIVVFGHEHRTVRQRLGGILYVNPGSPTFLHYHRGPGTVAILDIDSGEAQARIVHL